MAISSPDLVGSPKEEESPLVEVPSIDALAGKMDPEKDGVEQPEGGTDSPLWASLTTVNLVVGVGLLYLPGTFVTAGILPSIILCALVAGIVYYTTTLIVKVGHKIGKYSYEEICYEVIGSWGYYAIAVACILLNWGACMCYLLTVNKMISPVIVRLMLSSDTNPMWVTLFFLLLVMGPLSMFKDLSALSIVSSIKAVVMTLTVLVVIIQSNLASVQDYQKFEKWTYVQAYGWMEDVADKSGIATPAWKDDITTVGTRDDGSIEYSCEYKWDYFLREAFVIPTDISTAQAKEHDNANVQLSSLVGSSDASVRAKIELLRDSIDRESLLIFENPNFFVEQHEIKVRKNGEGKITNEEALQGAIEAGKERMKGQQNPKTFLTADFAKTFRKLVNRNWQYAEDLSEYGETSTKSRKQPDGWGKLGYFTPYWASFGVFFKLGTICFSFVFHDSIFSVHKGVANPSVQTWQQTAKYALFNIFTLQVVFALVVALAFGTEFPADNNCLNGDAKDLSIFPITSWVTMAVQFCFSAILMMTYPVCLVLCREYVESIMTLCKADKTDGKVDLNAEYSRMTSMTIAGILMGLTIPFICNETLGDLGDNALDIFGTLACGLMAFVMPPYCYWKVFGWSSPDRSCTDRYLPWIIFITGWIVTVGGFTIALLDVFGLLDTWPDAPDMTEL